MIMGDRVYSVPGPLHPQTTKEGLRVREKVHPVEILDFSLRSLLKSPYKTLLGGSQNFAI